MSSSDQAVINLNFISTMCRLKSQQKYFDRVTNTAITTLKNNVLSPDFLNHYQELAKKRQDGFKYLTAQLIDIILSRKKLKKDITDKKKLKDLDISYVKKNLFDIERKISFAKEQSTSELERLRYEEKELKSDLEKILKNDLLEDEQSKKVSLKKNDWNYAPKCNSEDVTNFMNFLHAHGGHEGGWSAESHYIFLKYYKQNDKDIIGLIKVLTNFLPEISQEAVIEHVEWYLEYEVKKEKYKNAIIRWRENKNKEKLKMFNKEITIPNQTIVKDKNETNVALKIDHSDIKAKIKEWKEKKFKQLEEEKKNLTQKSREAKKIPISEKQRKKIKIKIEEWKKKKTIDEQKRNTQEQLIEDIRREFRIIESRNLIKQFQAQDQQFLERRRELKSYNEKTKTVSRSRSLTSIKAERDPNRVHRATKQWLAKMCSPSHENNGDMAPMKVSINVNNIPKLKKPDWFGSLPYVL